MYFLLTILHCIAKSIGDLSVLKYISMSWLYSHSFSMMLNSTPIVGGTGAGQTLVCDEYSEIIPIPLCL